jgi:hypothetical protein
MIDKYFAGYPNFNTNTNYRTNDGFNSFTRFKNVEDCINTDDFMCDYNIDDESCDYGTYNLSTNFFSKNK